MNLFGLLMELLNFEARDKGYTYWAPFWYGCFAGVFPWIVCLMYFLGSGDYSAVPGFVYGILVTIFFAFNCFALNQWLQYRGKGRWADYAHGETVYIWLSLIAKSLLAWQIWGNTLIE